MPIPQFLAELRKKVGHDLLLLPTVVVIARDEVGRVLLVHDHDSDQWTLIGGIIEPGEIPADAGVREVWEEAQVHVELTHMIGVLGGPECETRYSNGDRIAWVVTIFAARATDAKPVADGCETREARFVTMDELAGMNVRADALRFLEAERACAGGSYFQPASWQPDSSISPAA